MKNIHVQYTIGSADRRNVLVLLAQDDFILVFAKKKICINVLYIIDIPRICYFFNFLKVENMSSIRKVANAFEEKLDRFRLYICSYWWLITTWATFDVYKHQENQDLFIWLFMETRVHHLSTWDVGLRTFRKRVGTGQWRGFMSWKLVTSIPFSACQLDWNKSCSAQSLNPTFKEKMASFPSSLNCDRIN